MGVRKGTRGVNVIAARYIYVWKCDHGNCYFVQLYTAIKIGKKK
jgi:hypothetical protein